MTEMSPNGEPIYVFINGRSVGRATGVAVEGNAYWPGTKLSIEMEEETTDDRPDTPVTDDDREAHDWADTVGNQKGWSDRIHAVVRAIRAHVPAPPATLADELRTRAHACIGPDGNPIFGGDETPLVLADRVEAVERELNSERRNTQHLSDLLMRESDSSTKLSAALDEARAEVEQWQSNTGQANLDLAKAQRERDDAREKLADKLDEVAQLHAEVERLSRDREDQERALVEHGRLLSEARAEVDAAGLAGTTDHDRRRPHDP